MYLIKDELKLSNIFMKSNQLNLSTYKRIIIVINKSFIGKVV